MRMVGTNERNGRKRKERKNACSGEPHDGREERNREKSGSGRERMGIRKKKELGRGRCCAAAGFREALSFYL
jgi:hypothetical protein